MYNKILDLTPEQIFLIQGKERAFNEIVENISKEVSNLEHLKLSRFSKEEARILIDFNLERSGEAWLVVYFDVFMNDAAQVLLKTLEEPSKNHRILLVTPHPYLVPQTIRSRVRLILSEDLASVNHTEALPPYLVSKKAAHEYVKETFGKESEDDASVRRAQATHLLDALEQKVKNDPEKLRAVYEAKDMLFKANMPTKQVVEYVVTMVF